jgi:hypothetical protein
MKYCRVALLVVVASWLIAGAAWAQTVSDKEIKAYFDIMRKDVRKEKQAVVDQAMALEAAQKSQFWAIYTDYQTALDAIWDQRLVNVKKYADTFEKMTDEIADQLAVKMMDLEAQRATLRNKYFKIYKEKMGARTAARFLQVECTLAYLVDLKIASEIPILP